MKDSDFRTILDRMIPNIGFGVRLGATIQGSATLQKKNTLDGFTFDTVYVEPRFSGKVNSWLSWQANFNANAGSYGASGVHVMDLIVQFNFHDAFHLWGGHLLVPSDRSNFAGPFFMSPWNYPGVYSAGTLSPKGGFFVGPDTGPFGRDTGAVVWGNFLGGKLNYYLGAFGLENVTRRPKIAARVSVDIIGEEPGFWGSSTYYGEKNVVGIGGGFEFRKADAAGPTPAPTLTCTPGSDAGTFSCIQNPVVAAAPGNDEVIGMVDLLAEGKFGGSLEAAYYHFDKSFAAKQAYFVLASYLIPVQLGVGKLQPLFRFQQAFGQSSGQQNIIDAALAYVVDGYNTRFHLGYQRQDIGTGPAENAIQIGAQIQK